MQNSSKFYIARKPHGLVQQERQERQYKKDKNDKTPTSQKRGNLGSRYRQV